LDTKDFIHGEGVKESQKETDFKPLKGIFWTNSQDLNQVICQILHRCCLGHTMK
jgi:hypothetical protein